MSAREIKAELTARGVSSAGCIERADLVALLEACQGVRGEDPSSERASAQLRNPGLSSRFGGLGLVPERDVTTPDELLDAGAAKWVNQAYGI